MIKVRRMCRMQLKRRTARMQHTRAVPSTRVRIDGLGSSGSSDVERLLGYRAWNRVPERPITSKRGAFSESFASLRVVA